MTAETSPTRRKWRKRAAIALIVAIVALTTLMALRAREASVTLTFTAADVQQQIGSEFPIRKNLLVASVTLGDPRVLLDEGSDRIGLEVNVEAKPLGGRPVTGTIAAGGRLRYAPDEGAFYLQDAKVTELHAEGVARSLEAPAAELASTALRGYLEKTPIYRLKPDDLKQVIARRVLRSAQVRNGRVTVVLGL